MGGDRTIPARARTTYQDNTYRTTAFASSNVCLCTTTHHRVGAWVLDASRRWMTQCGKCPPSRRCGGLDLALALSTRSLLLVRLLVFGTLATRGKPPPSCWVARCRYRDVSVLSLARSLAMALTSRLSSSRHSSWRSHLRSLYGVHRRMAMAGTSPQLAWPAAVRRGWLWWAAR